MTESFNNVLEQLYDALKEDGLLPSYYSDLLYSLKKKHEKELEAACRGFMEDSFGEHFDAGELSRRSIEAFQLNQERKEVCRMLTKYYNDPSSYSNAQDDLPFVGQVVSHTDILNIIMEPNDCWSASDLYNRLIYLLGGEDA